jgi:hypothetical protein
MYWHHQKSSLIRIARDQRVWLFSVWLSAWAIIGFGNISVAAPPRNLVVSAGTTQVDVLTQNWTDDEANWFYNVPQGSKLIPYTWFLHLEQANSQTPFRDTEHIRSLGYLPRTPDNPGNPDGLPIGFVRDGDHLGLTCAACHTAQINYQGRAWLVDGAPTLGDIATFQTRLVDALDKTLNDPAKFARFAQAVLGNAAAAGKDRLQVELAEVLATRQGYNGRNAPRPGAAPFGPGRVDAFGAILNEVTTTIAEVPGNDAPANAPVSYPFLWDTPQHDFVQWNGAAPNTDLPLAKLIIGTAHIGALGRNAGEVMGVFGTVDASHEGSLLQFRGYASSVNKTNLIAIEESLRKLWSPQWPTTLPPIDQTLRSRGEQLFKDNCIGCHAIIQRTDPARTVVASMKAVGTDQTMASNFATRTAKSGVFQGRLAGATNLHVFGPVEPVKDLLVHTVERVVLWRPPGISLHLAADELLIRPDLGLNNQIYVQITAGNSKLLGAFTDIQVENGKVRKLRSPSALRLIDAQQRRFRQDLHSAVSRFVSPDGQVMESGQLSGVQLSPVSDGTEVTLSDSATVQFRYKGRPLNGIWATAPYLHNGSVPNLDELLKPPAKRVLKFHLGSREFDPATVGFRVDQGDFEFDTALPGNSNAGHEYNREFTDDERKQLIEYMKSL